ncbi:sensor histidine kinase [Sulfurimonas sp.]|uniref:sensor histidine kinase n=1 Tax=Sulfurimonas sp. TaxID=2022749 RepID=UPI003566D408
MYKLDNKNKTIHKLQNNLNSFNRLSNSLSVPFFAKDKEGKYIECNRAFLDLINKQKEDILHTTNSIQETLYILHHEMDAQLLKKDSIHYKEIFALKSQKPKVYEFYKSAINIDGSYVGYVCIMIDITEHEKHENELQWSVHQESEKNKEILIQHEQEQLANVKFTAIGQLAAGITHEINTPLTYVKGNIEMVKMDLEDLPDDYQSKEQILEDIKDIQSGIDRISTIVESMREMSQHTKVELKRINIYSTLITALIMAHNNSKHLCKIYINGEEFTLESSKNRFEYLADVEEQRLEQAWIIIINNALDALKKKPNYDDRKLSIEISEVNSYIEIKFIDNAGGISEDIVDDLFEPFVSDKPEGGMGVGLSIAKKILDAQSATIEAYNENNGAVFKITIKKS